MKTIQDLNDMVLFARVVEHGGYTAAARVLGVQASTLSRRITELETQLGVRLLNRTTRSISVSEAGQHFHRHCLVIVAEAEAAQDAIERTLATPQGLVRLSCPVALLQGLVAPILSRYLAYHAQVRLHVEATNRRVDVVDEGIDLALRVRQPPLEDSDLAVRPLGTSQFVLVGSPWLLAQHGRPVDAAALAQLPTLSMVRPGDKHVWDLRTAAGEPVVVPHVPRLMTDDLSTMRQAALESVGVAALPLQMVADDLAAGRLEQVLGELSLPQGIVHVVFASRRGQVPAVRALIDALVKGFEALE